MRCWHGYLLERSANSLHMVQLMSLPPHQLRFRKIQNGLLFWYRLTQVVPDKGSQNSCTCLNHKKKWSMIVIQRQLIADRDQFSSAAQWLRDALPNVSSGLSMCDTSVTFSHSRDSCRATTCNRRHHRVGARPLQQCLFAVRQHTVDEPPRDLVLTVQRWPRSVYCLVDHDRIILPVIRSRSNCDPGKP